MAPPDEPPPYSSRLDYAQNVQADPPSKSKIKKIKRMNIRMRCFNFFILFKINVNSNFNVF